MDRGSSNLFLIIVQYSAWSQCPICKANSDNLVWAMFVRKCVNVLRESGWFVERVPENKNIKQILRQSWWSWIPWKPSSLLCLGNPSPELRGWGLPVGGMCAYFPAARLKRNALCSNCWMASKPLGKSRLAESVSKLQFRANIWKELYMKAEANFWKCLKIRLFACVLLGS